MFFFSFCAQQLYFHFRFLYTKYPITNFAKIGKMCNLFFICVSDVCHLIFFIANNTGSNFCLLNILRCKIDREKFIRSSKNLPKVRYIKHSETKQVILQTQRHYVLYFLYISNSIFICALVIGFCLFLQSLFRNYILRNEPKKFQNKTRICFSKFNVSNSQHSPTLYYICFVSYQYRITFKTPVCNKKLNIDLHFCCNLIFFRYNYITKG